MEAVKKNPAEVMQKERAKQCYARIIEQWPRPSDKAENEVDFAAFQKNFTNLPRSMKIRETRATDIAKKRLQKELKEFQSNPPSLILAVPEDDNILLWHYCIQGAPGTPYEGGVYLGMIRFPSEYPFAPPRITMSTPNGRFMTNVRLCLSISDYHPETWNPAWTCETILIGLQSFMGSEEITAGYIEGTAEERRMLAQRSHAFNAAYDPCKKYFKQFCCPGMQSAPSSTTASVKSTTTKVTASVETASRSPQTAAKCQALPLPMEPPLVAVQSTMAMMYIGTPAVVNGPTTAVKVGEAQ